MIRDGVQVRGYALGWPRTGSLRAGSYDLA